MSADPSTGLTKIFLGSTEYVLTRDAGSQNVTLGNIPDPNATRVNVYSITGGLPAGNWESIKIEGPTGTFIPPTAGQLRGVGLYIGLSNFWHGSLYNAPAGNLNLPFVVPVEQTLPAEPVNKSLTFTAPTQPEIPYLTQNPFTDVLRIEMQTGAGQPRENQYTVRMEQAVTGNNVPVRLKVGTALYDLAPVAESTNHSFTTSVIPPADRVSATDLMQDMDIQYAGGHWAEGGAGKKLPYTLQLHELQRALALPHSGSAFPSQAFDGEIFQLTHTQVLDGTTYAPDTYIYLNSAWGVPNVRTQAEAEALVRRLVADWAEAANTDELPFAKLPYTTLQTMLTTLFDARYSQPGSAPFPSLTEIADANIGTAEIPAEEATGNRPHSVAWAFPAWNDPPFVPQPGQSSGGTTTGETVAPNPRDPFLNRVTYFSPTFHTSANRDRFRFNLNPHVQIPTPVSIGISTQEDGGAELRLACAADSHGTFLTDPVGAAGYRPARAGQTLYVQLYDALSRPLIIDPVMRSHRYVEATKLTNSRLLWQWSEGGNKPFVDTSLGHTQPDHEFHNPGSDPAPLAVDDIPAGCEMQIRAKLGGRTGIISSLWLPTDVFKALPDLATVAGGQTAGQAVTTAVSPQVLQSLVPSSENVDYAASPNTVYFDIRGQDAAYFGNWGGSFAFRVDNWSYWAVRESDVWVYVRGWEE